MNEIEYWQRVFLCMIFPNGYLTWMNFREILETLNFASIALLGQDEHIQFKVIYQMLSFT